MLKKRYIGASLLVLCCAARLWAADADPAVEAPTFSLPIPVVSDPAQVNPFTVTHTDATNFKFFRHPAAPAGSTNFNFPLVTLPDGRQVHADIIIDGQPYLVSDIVATPGLMSPKGREVENESGMIDDLGARRDIDLRTLQGFCQGEMLLQDQNGLLVDAAVDCQINDKKNVMLNRQLQIADIRQDAGGELNQLLGADPLVSAVIGSAQELLPYNDKLYPATAGERLKGIYQFLSGKEDLRNSKDIVVYDIAELEQLGVVGPAYDPIVLPLKMALSAGMVNANGNFGEQGLIFESTGAYYSPLVFFRKDSEDQIGRMKLSGYSAFKIPDFLVGARNGMVPGAGVGDFLAAAKLLLYTQNSAPIAVEEMAYPQIAPNARVQPVDKLVPADGLHGMAAVNQALWGDWRSLYLNAAGRPFISDVDGPQRKIYQWFDVFGFQNQQGGFVPLHDEFIFPSNLGKFSHAVFWGRFGEKWGQHLHRGNLVGLNPNMVYDAFMTGFVGPQSYDAAVLENGLVEGGARKTTTTQLIVPAGVSSDADAAGQPGGALYSLNPFGGKRVYFKDPARPNDPAQELPIVWPEVYQVDLPSALFVPYGVKSAELGNKEPTGKFFCGDVVLTFRGAESVAAKGAPFNNDSQEPVLFRASANDARMFSDHVHVHFGFVHQEDNRFSCALSKWDGTAPDIDLTVKSPLEPMNVPAQVASVKLADFNGDGSTDLLVGDLVPRKIPMGQHLQDEGRYTAYAYLYPSFVTAVERIPQPVRTGFKTFTYGEVGIDEPQDMQSVANAVAQLAVDEDHKGLLGVAVLEADQQQEGGSHIGVINGLPLTVAPFGCPKLNNAEVSSPVELMQSLTKNLLSQQIADRVIVNGDGLAQFPTPFIDQGITLAQSCTSKRICTMNLNGNEVQLPFWQEDACCQNACDERSQIWKDGTCKRFLDLAEPDVNHDWANGIIAHIEQACAQNNGQPPLVDAEGDPQVPPVACHEFVFRDDRGVEQRLEFPDGAPDICCQDPCGELNGNHFPLQECAFAAHGGDAADAQRNAPLLADACNGIEAGGANQPPPAPFVACNNSIGGWNIGFRAGDVCCNNPCDPRNNPNLSNEEAWQQQLDQDLQEFDCEARMLGVNAALRNQMPNLCHQLDQGEIRIEPRAALNLNQDELVAQIGTWQPDRVYSSRGNFIAALSDLQPAQGIRLQDNGPVGQEVLDFNNDIQAHEDPARGNVSPPNVEPADGNPIPRVPANVRPLNGIQQQGIRAVQQPIPGAIDDIRPNGFVVRVPPAVRLPMGKVMPGARELNVLVNKKAPQAWACNPVGPLEDGAECNFEKPCANGNSCDQNTCQCVRDCRDGNLQPELGEECDIILGGAGAFQGCAAGESCNINCQCEAPLVPPGPGPGPNVDVNSNLANSCECHVSGFSSTAAKNAYAGFNQEFRNASGINGDLWGEPEFSTMNCVCILPGAAAPGLNADIGVNLAGNVLPNVPGNVRPWALVQDSGLTPTMNYNNEQWRPDANALVTAPILLMPSDAAQMNAAILPDLAVNPSFAAATPLPAGNASVIADPSGTQVTDIGKGMLRHVLFAAMPGSLIQFQGTRVQLPDLSVGRIGGVPNTGAAVHEISIRIPPDYATLTGIKGYKGSKNIEDRLFDGELILAEVKTKCEAARQAGKFCTLNDFDFKGQWESNLYFHGALVANTFSKAGEPSGTATAQIHVLGGTPFNAGAAHSCGCNTAAQAPSAAEALAQALAFIGVLAVWKRLRKKA